ncbi:MAG: STAS domain-containing protein [Ilumatobacteraceae bacterium]
MSLSLRRETVGGVDILALNGAVDLSTLPRVADALNRAVAEGQPVVAVDLEAISVIDDAALGTLLGAASRLRREDRRLVLISSDSRIVQHLEATGVASIVPVVPSLSSVTTSQ